MSWPDSTSNTIGTANTAHDTTLPSDPPGPTSPRKNHREKGTNGSLNSIGAARSAVLLLEPDLDLQEADCLLESAGETDSLLGSALPSPRRTSKMAGEAHHDATPLLRARSESALPRQLHDPAFAAIVAAVEEAIQENILPEMIVRGSSGSYFCRNKEKQIVAVFKPKNEEPYGDLNPKWGKWVQKHFCCCMYGRDCLLQNAGYMSEAGASLVDGLLGLNIVPVTRVVKLISPSFHYSRFDRARARAVRSASRRFPETVGRHLRQGLPPKVGSFQLFVKGYQDATEFFKQHVYEQLPASIKTELQHQFELMCILDYLTRNTDRGSDNWLIKYTPPDANGNGSSIKLAAIDNGLSFPFKHPDNWRTYPFYWAWMPLAKVPFSEPTVERILPLLSNDDFIEELGDQLYVLFSQDKGFSRRKFEQQLAVLRGQALNLRTALQERRTPEQLVHMRTAQVFLQGSSGEGRQRPQYRQMVSTRRPFFSWF